MGVHDNLIRETNVSPHHLGVNEDQDVFVINDISLVVPPAQISVQKEDLTYKWKTLRTKTTTKIPTGHGKVVAHVTIVFPEDELLALHRLVVQFKHSPFCYIENRYIRESIVPGWPSFQNMAFTMTSINVTPMSGSSDMWQCEIDLLWFNYFPFMHNYLFREEWETNPIKNTVDADDISVKTWSIGWDLAASTQTEGSSYIKLSSPIRIASAQQGALAQIDYELDRVDAIKTGKSDALFTNSWSSVLGHYNNNTTKTIYEMQNAHPGIEFDLLPLPDNMKPARVVSDPRNSRIYTRFINLLQRDALLKNFGIDVEAGILASNGIGSKNKKLQSPRWKALFQYHTSERGKVVTPLHSSETLKTGSRVVPLQLKKRWIESMVSHNNGVRFLFHAYQEVHFPVEWQDKILSANKNAIAQSLKAADLSIAYSPVLPFLGSPEAVKKFIDDSGLGNWRSEARVNAQLILEQFVAHGYPVGFAIACLVNAVAESGLDHEATTDLPLWIREMPVPPDREQRKIPAKALEWRHKVNKLRAEYGTTEDGRAPLPLDRRIYDDMGLFQLGNYAGALGDGLTTDVRRDPHQNIATVINYIKSEVDDDTRILNRAAHAPDKTIKELIELFVTHLEKPKGITTTEGKAAHHAERTERGRKLFGNLIDLPIGDPSLQLVLEDSASKIEELKAKEEEARKIGAATSKMSIIASENEVEIPELEKLAAAFIALRDDGWIYYDRFSDIINVWQKPVSIQLLHETSNTLQYGDLKKVYFEQGAVLTNISGGLSHIVASIPVLSHEYPTQQHLGSIEPQYTMEFAILDDQENLEGLSQVGAFIEHMRDTLQHNSRKYRPVLDGWCVATDTFITRFFGSYEERDLLDDAEGIPQVLKRTAVSRSSSSTVPRSPGLSILQLGLEETNVYQPSLLRSTGPDLEDKNTARKEALAAILTIPDLLNKDNAKKYLALVIAQLARSNTKNAQVEGYGEFALDIYGDTKHVKHIEPATFLYKEDDGQLSLVINELTKESMLLLEELGLTDQLRTSLITEPSDFNHYGGKDPYSVPGIRIPLATLEGLGITQEGGEATNRKNSLNLDSKSFNILKYLDEDPALGNLPIAKILAYYFALQDTMTVASRMMAEEQVGGFNTTKIQAQLFDLPVTNFMWQSWQTYLTKFVTLQDRTLYADLSSTLNWPSPKGPWKTKLIDPHDFMELAAIAEQPYGYAGLEIQAFQNVTGSFTAPISNAIGGISSSGDTAASARTSHNKAIKLLVRRYLRNLFPKSEYLSYLGNDFKELVNALLPINILGSEAGIPAAVGMEDQLAVNAYSCGNITAGPYSGNPIWQSTRSLQTKVLVEDDFGGLKFLSKPPTRVTPTGILGYFANSAPGNGAFMKTNVPGTSFNLQNSGLISGLGVSTTTVGATPHSPFKYEVSVSAEEKKLEYLTDLFSKLADGLLADVQMLKFLKLEHLYSVFNPTRIVGSQAYPDLELPFHPYYGDNLNVYPDFYMWNIYDDGQAFTDEFQLSVKEAIDVIVDRSYESMAKLKSGHKWDESKDKAIQIGNITDPYVVTTQMSAEGTDFKPHSGKNAQGATAFPFSLEESDITSLGTWDKAVEAEKPDLKTELTSKNHKEIIKEIQFAASEAPIDFEGGDYATNPHYPSRLGIANVIALREKMKSVETMFGNRHGYLGQILDKKTAPQITQDIEGSALETSDEYTHRFDANSLKRLAADSSKDIVSRKLTMRRAHPTFKLFFIEEDEFESRFLNYDDFHSYNAVKEFSVVMNRKMPADHAVITIQNVGGSLDGTRRDTISDADYLTGHAKDKLKQLAEPNDPDVSAHPTPYVSGTTSEQPFGSIVLRPGINVQLRAGYSNDPDNLHVLVNGRVVDIAWNKIGDMAEITVQSFGAELIQQIKGTGRRGEQTTYATTHQLLGSLMLSPELMHFGRWEFGQLFQYGEGGDARLDFTDYSREGFLGRFKYASGFAHWLSEHPYIYGAAVVGGAIFSFLPMGRGLSGLSKTSTTLLKIAGLSGIAGRLRNIPMAFSSMAKAKGITRLTGPTQHFLTKANTVSKGRKIQFARRVPGFGKKVVSNGSSHFGPIAKVTIMSKGVWVSKVVTSVVAGGVTTFSTKAVAGGAFKALTTTGIAPTAKIIGALALLDVITNEILTPLHDSTIGNTRRFFTRTNVGLKLSPQDDNLYPPHPKDYMTLLDETSWTQSTAQAAQVAAKASWSPIWGLVNAVSKALNKAGGKGSSVPATGSVSSGGAGTSSLVRSTFVHGSRLILGEDNNFTRLVLPDTIIPKTVEPQACQYQIINDTIWNIFHEMTLRHPGWIYGARPYGTQFRYTMFFGIPSQRYWARPASNLFIQRTIDLRRFITAKNYRNHDAFLEAYEDLYGERAALELQAESLRAGTTLSQKRRERNARASSVDLSRDNIVVDTGDSSILIEGSQQSLPLETGEYSLPVGRRSDFVETFAQRTYSPAPKISDAKEIEAQESNRGHAIAMQEYLRALEIRFIPFRRYHLLTSEQDIVWNGLLSSEQAATNAVDVTYYGTQTETSNNPYELEVNTTLVKAHSMISPKQLRIAPIRYPNCKSYAMALRYGMGELLHRVRDMYRGEIIVLGNPRIRPWDQAIIVDSYNDMVGPVEVEQVVHTFSHETGFITEIKPSALVYANETSSWPVTTAIHLYAMAIMDVEKRYAGIRANDTNPKFNSGFLGTVAGLIARFGAKDVSALKKKYDDIFPNSVELDDVSFASEYRTPDAADSAIQSIANSIGYHTSDINGANREALSTVGVLGLSTSLAGGVLLGKDLASAYGAAAIENGSVIKTLKTSGVALLKTPRGIVGGGALLGGIAIAAGATALNWSGWVGDQISFPSTAYLLGSPILFLQCLRNDTIVVVPLMKNGHPIISGFNYNDPAMLWNNIGGELNRLVDDTISGTKDMTSLWYRYGYTAWEQLGKPGPAQLAWTALSTTTDPELTGEDFNPLAGSF